MKNSRKLASVIVKARATQRIATIGEFLEIVKPLFGREREKKEHSFSYGSDNKQGEMASCGISAPVI